MLIRALKAENFMRFSTLRLRDLPPDGLVGIEGPNETGKTTIGKAILFALFGKTGRQKDLTAAHLIRWDADYLSVEMEFTVPAHGDYLLYREIDRRGTNFVKVVDSESRRELATGNIKVAELLRKLLNCDLLEFKRSFYMDQRQEIDGNWGHGDFVEQFAGLSYIREARRIISKEVEQIEREHSLYQKDIQRNQNQIEKLERELYKLGELRESVLRLSEEISREEEKEKELHGNLENLRQIQKDHNRRASLLEGAAGQCVAEAREVVEEIAAAYREVVRSPGAAGDFVRENRDSIARHMELLDELGSMAGEFSKLRSHYQELLEELKRRTSADSETGLTVERKKQEEVLSTLQKSCGRLSLGAVVAFVISGVFWGTFGVISSGGALSEYPLRAFVQLGFEQRGSLAVLSGMGGVAFLVFLVLLALRVQRGGRLQQVAQELARLELGVEEETEKQSNVEKLMSTGDVGEFVDAAQSIDDPVRKSHLEEFIGRFQKHLQRDETGKCTQVPAELARTERELASLAGKAMEGRERQIQHIGEKLEARRARRDRQEMEIREGEGQISRKESLGEKNEELKERSRAVLREIECRKLASNLLKETASSIKSRIGPSLARFVREVLPRLTKNRYMDVKMDSQLALKLFTSERGDFLSPVELSGGAMEAVALTLRLALSQALVSSRVKHSQFIFLDEPFKMIDGERACEALKLLRELSPDLRQIFIVEPEFSREQRDLLDLVIRTPPDESELV